MWIPESWRDLHVCELAYLLTERARQAVSGIDLEVVWDGMWVVRSGEWSFPQPDLTTGREPDWHRIALLHNKYLRDAHDYWFHLYKPKPGDTIVDIGAGRGEDVFAFSLEVGESGHVWAIEPHPVSYAALQSLCALNKFGNVRMLNYACIERRAELQIETMPVWESNYVREGAPSSTSHHIQGIRFDDLADEINVGPIDFLKMNIEGAERLALPGCRLALDRTRHVCIAAHDFRSDRGEGEDFRTLQFVRDFLQSCGFKLVTRDNDPRYYVPYHVHGVRP